MQWWGLRGGGDFGVGGISQLPPNPSSPPLPASGCRGVFTTFKQSSDSKVGST